MFAKKNVVRREGVGSVGISARAVGLAAGTREAAEL